MRKYKAYFSNPVTFWTSYRDEKVIIFKASNNKEAIKKFFQLDKKWHNQVNELYVFIEPGIVKKINLN